LVPGCSSLRGFKEQLAHGRSARDARFAFKRGRSGGNEEARKSLNSVLDGSLSVLTPAAAASFESWKRVLTHTQIIPAKPAASPHREDLEVELVTRPSASTGYLRKRTASLTTNRTKDFAERCRLDPLSEIILAPDSH